MTYKEIKSQIKALNSAIHQAEMTDNKYATSGRMDTHNKQLRELQDQLSKSTIILDPSNTVGAMNHIKAFAETATCSDDFEDCGVYFNIDKTKSLLWWLAEILPLPKGITVKQTLNDLQRIREVTETIGATWTMGSMDGSYDDFHATVDHCEFTSKSPSIAMLIATVDLIIIDRDAKATPPSKPPGT